MGGVQKLNEIISHKVSKEYKQMSVKIIKMMFAIVYLAPSGASMVDVQCQYTVRVLTNNIVN